MSVTMGGTYFFRTTGVLLSHFPQQQPLVRDTHHAPGWSGQAENDDAGQLFMHARVRSGDYFETLATELDELAQSIPGANKPQTVALERLVSELLYLQKHYRITPKLKMNFDSESVGS